VTPDLEQIKQREQAATAEAECDECVALDAIGTYIGPLEVVGCKQHLDALRLSLADIPALLAAIDELTAQRDKVLALHKRNHWNNDGDLVIEQKTLFRLLGYLGHSGTWYPNDGTWPTASQEPGGYSPLYQQIATWVEGEGWHD
jgi:hypothetical protein